MSDRVGPVPGELNEVIDTYDLCIAAYKDVKKRSVTTTVIWVLTSGELDVISSIVTPSDAKQRASLAKKSLAVAKQACFDAVGAPETKALCDKIADEVLEALRTEVIAFNKTASPANRVTTWVDKSIMLGVLSSALNITSNHWLHRPSERSVADDGSVTRIFMGMWIEELSVTDRGPICALSTTKLAVTTSATGDLISVKQA